MMRIYGTGTVPDITYALGATTQNTWTHSAFIINASSAVRAICGDLKYTANEGVLDPYLSYDAATRSFEIQTDNSALLAQSPFTYSVSAELAAFPGVGKVTESGLVTIKNACGSAFQPYNGVVPNIQYYYNLGMPATFTFPEEIIAPAMCRQYASYTCSVVSSPYVGTKNLCSFMQQNGAYTSEATMNQNTGVMTFATNDKSMFPPGMYVFKITASMEGNSQAVTFAFILTDPCSTAQLFVDSNPFAGHHEYVLRDPALTIPFDLATIGHSATSVNCGEPMITIVTGTGQPIDGIFTQDNVNKRFMVG
jgi:hypothetical protein